MELISCSDSVLVNELLTGFLFIKECQKFVKGYPNLVSHFTGFTQFG
jgi:hypothetical protein